MGWLLALDHPYLTGKVLEGLEKDTIFAILTFLTGWTMNDKKQGKRPQSVEQCQTKKKKHVDLICILSKLTILLSLNLN